jgi:hypothetical protein
LNILLKAEWKDFYELKKLSKSALQAYCDIWHNSANTLQLLYDVYDDDPEVPFCGNPSTDDKSNKLAHQICPQIEHLFFLQVPWYDTDCLYDVLHGQWKAQNELDRTAVAEESMKVWSEGLKNSQNLRMDRLILESIAQAIKDADLDVMENLDLNGGSIVKRFAFMPGQVLFDGKDINIKTGVTQEILKALVDNFGRVIPFNRLEIGSSDCEASITLRDSIRHIREKLEKLPVVIKNRRGAGYIMTLRD